MVKEVLNDSSASIAGFEVGDEIVSFSYGEGDEIVMRNLYSLEDHIFNFSMGDIVMFKVVRGSREITLSLKIKSLVAADSKDWYK